jgi:hypothetical protein
VKSRIVSPYEFAALRADGTLQYLAGSTIIVCAGAYDADYEVCHIVFGSDGSIYVQCPKFPHEDGVLTEARFPVPNEPPFQINFSLKNGLTPDRVKYSHHTSGAVHFSQTGKMPSRFERRSIPLAMSIGRLFQLFVYHPYACSALRAEMPKRDRVVLKNRFKRGLPSGVVIVADWRRRDDIRNSARPAGMTIGPRENVVETISGFETQTWFIGQQSKSPLQDHILMLRCVETTVPTGVDKPTVILIGGWDPHEVPVRGQVVQQTGCLAFMYPGPLEALRERVAAADVVPLLEPVQ